MGPSKFYDQKVVLFNINQTANYMNKFCLFLVGKLNFWGENLKHEYEESENFYKNIILVLVIDHNYL